MGIKTVPQPSYSPNIVSCKLCLFLKLRGCRYDTTEEMKEAVTKVIDTLTQEDFDGAFQMLLEQYNKCIATGGDYFEGDQSFMCVLSIKVPIRKKSENLFNDPRTLIKFLLKSLVSGSFLILLGFFVHFLSSLFSRWYSLLISLGICFCFPSIQMFSLLGSSFPSFISLFFLYKHSTFF